MPRTKAAKRTAKRQSANNKVLNVNKIEKELLEAPSKLVAQLNKEINLYKKRENRSAKALNKLHASIEKAEARSKDAKEKITPAGKKQFKKWKKAYVVFVKKFAEVEKEYQIASSKLAVLLEKQAKFSAIQKHLDQFDKEWLKSSKKAKSSAKTNRSKKSIKDNAVLPVLEQPAPERREVLVENTHYQEPTELTS